MSGTVPGTGDSAEPSTHMTEFHGAHMLLEKAVMKQKNEKTVKRW